MSSVNDTETDTDTDTDTYPSSDELESQMLNPPSFQVHRLAPARVLHASGIHCIIWGCDALEFAHRIPGGNTDCHLLIVDEHLVRAAELIISELGYVSTEPDPYFYEFASSNPAQPHAYPDSIRLGRYSTKDTPKYVLLTPMSYFYVDETWCSDSSRTTCLPQPEENSMLLYPTLPAYLDSLIATYLEPRHGRHEWLETNLGVDIAYLAYSRLKKKDQTGHGMISEAEEQVILGVRRENQPFLRRMIVRCIQGGWPQYQKERRMILSNLYSVGGCSCQRCTETVMTG